MDAPLGTMRAGTQRSCGVMFPEQIPIDAYTHINFAFAYINPTSFAIAPMDASQPELYGRVTSLKQMKPGLQAWISVGGWSMNDPDQPTHSTFSQLAASAASQQAFFTSLISFMHTYGFDGVDLDWEYPVAAERSGQTGKTRRPLDGPRSHVFQPISPILLPFSRICEPRSPAAGTITGSPSPFRPPTGTCNTSTSSTLRKRLIGSIS